LQLYLATLLLDIDVRPGSIAVRVPTANAADGSAGTRNGKEEQWSVFHSGNALLWQQGS